jgi:hypothetical protein
MHPRRSWRRCFSSNVTVKQACEAIQQRDDAPPSPFEICYNGKPIPADGYLPDGIAYEEDSKELEVVCQEARLPLRKMYHLQVETGGEVMWSQDAPFRGDMTVEEITRRVRDTLGRMIAIAKGGVRINHTTTVKEIENDRVISAIVTAPTIQLNLNSHDSPIFCFCTHETFGNISERVAERISNHPIAPGRITYYLGETRIRGRERSIAYFERRDIISIVIRYRFRLPDASSATRGFQVDETIKNVSDRWSGLQSLI